MPYNTGNAIGSKDPRDLYDNAVTLDSLVNGDLPNYPDRFGNLKLSFNGMKFAFNESLAGWEAAFQSFLLATSFEWLGDYAAGLNFTRRSQYTVRAGIAYRLSDTASLPFTTTGTWSSDSAKFVAFQTGDVLRQDLMASTGAGIVKTASGDSVQVALDGKAKSGANDDITSLSGMTTPLSASQGGTGNTTGSIAVQASFKNLSLRATGLSAGIQIYAEELVVKSADGVPSILRNIWLNLNLASAGLNGVDSGAVYASSWYSLWVLRNGSSGAVGCIAALMPIVTGATTASSGVVTGLSSTASMRVGMPVSGGSLPAGTVIASVDSASQVTLSSLATTSSAGVPLRFVYEPVMPAGYTDKARVSSFFTDASANKFPLGFVQQGRRLQYVVRSSSNMLAYPLVASGVMGQTSDTAPVFAQVSLFAFVPPTALGIRLVLRAGLTASAAASGIISVAPNAFFGGQYSSNPAPFSNNVGNGAQASSGSITSQAADMLLETYNLFYVANGSGNGVQLMGWEENL